MYFVNTSWVDCPYCAESIEIVIDCSVSFQEYIEDCEVCCRPIHLAVRVSVDGDILVLTSHEDQ